MITIDRLDADIIGRLSTHARIGIAELATQLGVARNTVQSRLRRLEESGVLTGFRPVVDLEAVGVVAQAFVALELEQRRLAEVVDALALLPQVLEITTQAGREDLLVRVAAPSHAELQHVVTQMIDTPGVRHTVTTMAVSTPLPYRTQPLLELLTRESGFGRATPASS
ncbi:MAG: Lrp/AsnC family transcriptional regulator [Aeromicrobium sp.]